MAFAIQAAMKQECGAGSQANPKPICVLQVEDNPMDALLLAADFSKQGPAHYQFRLTTAVRLSEAVQVLAGTPIDVILLDLFLEECTGLETLFRVRDVVSDVPVVRYVFNNALTVILGHCNLILEGMGSDNENRDSVESIKKAADRAAGSTTHPP